MPTYLYKTIPQDENTPEMRFELWQSMNDAPLKKHPKTGERVCRVVVGGVGMPGSISDPESSKVEPGGPDNESG